jgi:hypothetical protein
MPYTALFRFPKDNYDILGIHLLAKDHALVLSVIASTAPTEQDVVARALTFFYDWHHRSVEFGTLFITDEIGRNKSEVRLIPATFALAFLT